MTQATALPGAEELREMLAEDDGSLFAPEELSADQAMFLNRELSWLQFNRRVLLESADETLPAFERLRFLSIYGTNLDEFYMVRVGRLIDRDALRPWEGDPLTDMTPSEQLDAVAEETAAQLPLLEQQYETVREALKKQHIELMDCDRLSDEDKALAKEKFRALRPLLQPQIIERGQPLPFLRNKEIYALVLLGHGKHRAVGLVPTLHLPKYFVFHTEDATKLLPTAELVRRYAHTLFPDRKPEETALLRVTRNAEIDAGDVMDDCDADFRAVMERLLRRRRRLEPVRAQLSQGASGRMAELVRSELKLPENRVFRMALPLDLSFVQKLGTDVIPQDLRMQLPEPARVSRLKKGNYFEYLKRNDLLIALPYQSIDPLIDLLYEAADSPEVVSVSITLYRMAGSSRIAAALAYAAGQGKRVRCVLELRARFDEQNNIDYSRMLEASGCEIRYGLPEYKVHAKLCLIERRVPGGTIYYTQVGTGNYNESTAEQYTDLMLLTADPRVGLDAKAIFQALERGELAEETKALVTSPADFRPWLVRQIDTQAQLGSAGRIILKVNAMNDPVVMSALIRAAKAGTEVSLFVRGICCLRPGVPGETDHITVRSVIGRYLEHERILVFGRGGATRVFFGSGDLLERNTIRRVEAFAEVHSRSIREQLLAILEFMRLDNRKAWVMQPDGTYVRPAPAGRFISQAALQDYFAKRIVERPAPEPEPKPEPEPEPLRSIPQTPAAEIVTEEVPAELTWWQRFKRWLKTIFS